MDTLIKTEPYQPQFVDLPDHNQDSVNGGEEPANTSFPSEIAAAATPVVDTPQDIPNANGADISTEEWATKGTINGITRISSASTNSSSSSATHISAGSALNSLNPPILTPAVTGSDDSQRPFLTPDVDARQTQQTARSPPDQRNTHATLTSPTSHTPKTLPPSQSIAFDTDPPSSSQGTPVHRGGPLRTPVPKPVKVDDPLPAHLRTLLQEYYDRQGKVDLPPCALVSDNRQSIYIFPGGKKAKYVDRQGEEVVMRRGQLPETGYWVSIVEPPGKPAVFVKRLPKYGPTPGFTGTSLFIWNGIRGFEQTPSFFKVLAEKDTTPSAETDPISRPQKRKRLSEPRSADIAPGSQVRDGRVPSSASYPPHTAFPPSPMAHSWSRHSHDMSSLPGYRDVSATALASSQAAISKKETSSTYNSAGPYSQSFQSQWQRGSNPYSYSTSPYGPQMHMPSPATGDGGYTPQRSTYEGLSVYNREPSIAPSSSQALNGSRTASEAPQESPGILTPDQKGRTVVNFLGSRPRTRPFTLCDRVDKLFAQAAASGFKNFSLSAATFVMVRVRRAGQAEDDPSIQEVAVVSGDDLDFKQLQEVIREVGGDWHGHSPVLVECDVSTVD